jgi:histone-lysine N-methyltransferase SETD8
MVNHSKRVPNVLLKVFIIDGVPRLCLMALRNIDIGEELLYDYGERRKEVLDSNPWLMS